MRDLANEGKGILMVSSELPELLSVCDRIVVFGGGKIKAVFDAREATEEKLCFCCNIRRKHDGKEKFRLLLGTYRHAYDLVFMIRREH